MTIDKKQENDKVVLSLEGRLDTVTAPELQETLIEAINQNKEVVLDFEKLVYVSSAGLRVLLMGEKTAKANGAKQLLANVSAEIMEVFEMTGFVNILHIL